MIEITYSDYLQTRRFNRKLFELVSREIKRKLMLCDDLYIMFGMSAKHQTPYVKITGEEAQFAKWDVYNTLNTFFEVDEPEQTKDEEWVIDFRD